MRSNKTAQEPDARKTRKSRNEQLRLKADALSSAPEGNIKLAGQAEKLLGMNATDVSAMPDRSKFGLPNGLVACIYRISYAKEEVVTAFNAYWKPCDDKFKTETDHSEYSVVEVQVKDDVVYLFYPNVDDVQDQKMWIIILLQNDFKRTLSLAPFLMYNGRVHGMLEPAAQFIKNCIAGNVPPSVAILLSPSGDKKPL